MLFPSSWLTSWIWLAHVGKVANLWLIPGILSATPRGSTFHHPTAGKISKFLHIFAYKFTKKTSDKEFPGSLKTTGITYPDTARGLILAPFIDRSLDLSTYISICWSIARTVYLCLSIYLSIYLSIHASIYLSICISICIHIITCLCKYDILCHGRNIFCWSITQWDSWHLAISYTLRCRASGAVVRPRLDDASGTGLRKTVALTHRDVQHLSWVTFHQRRDMVVVDIVVKLLRGQKKNKVKCKVCNFDQNGLNAVQLTWIASR